MYFGLPKQDYNNDHNLGLTGSKSEMICHQVNSLIRFQFHYTLVDDLTILRYTQLMTGICDGQHKCNPLQSILTYFYDQNKIQDGG